MKSPLPKALRVLIPAVLIVAWLVGASIGGPYFGKVSEVSTNDQTSYLPESADATQVQGLLDDFLGSDSIPAVVVFASDDELSDETLADLEATVADLPEIEGVTDWLSPLIPSEDGLAAQAFVPISTDADTGDVLDEIKVALNATAPAGVTAYVTGPAGFTADLAAGFAGIDGILAVALGAVLIILIIVYRSLLLPVAVLATSLSALTVALLTVCWWLAKAEILLFSGQTQGILFILVIGAATDYALLYVARYREQLRITESRGQATMSALRGSIEPILASGGTVIAGLLCLMLSDLKSNSSLGPVASIGILFAMAAALTLLPAILYAFGRAAFWPRRPKFDPAAVEAEHGMPSKGVWAWLARIIKRRPRVIWLATTALLLLGAVGALQLNAQGVAQSALVLGASDARDGQAELGEHFPGGSGSPANVVTDEGQFDETADALLAIEGVDSLSVVADDSPSGTAPVTEDGIGAIGPPGTPAPEPTAVDGKVMLQATLSDAADSDAATDTVLQMRESIEAEGLNALVGGTTATAIDTNEASIHDRNLIIPIVLVVILLILMVLLRSVLAPVLLVLTTVVSFGTAMGCSAIVFNHVFEFPGADPAVPLYGFVFLVALGIDYNIFLMTRVRESWSSTAPERAYCVGSASPAASSRRREWCWPRPLRHCR